MIENEISDPALEEVFKDSNRTARFFTLLRFGEKNNQQPEDIVEDVKRRKLKR